MTSIGENVSKLQMFKMDVRDGVKRLGDGLVDIFVQIEDRVTAETAERSRKVMCDDRGA